jgi:hypothetical protein
VLMMADMMGICEGEITEQGVWNDQAENESARVSL